MINVRGLKSGSEEFIGLDLDVAFMGPTDQSTVDAALAVKGISPISTRGAVVTYELDSPRYRTAPSMLKRFLDVLEELPAAPAAALRRAASRTFDFGFAASDVRCRVVLSAALVARAAALDSAIAITVYAAPRAATRAPRRRRRS